MGTLACKLGDRKFLTRSGLWAAPETVPENQAHSLPLLIPDLGLVIVSCGNRTVKELLRILPPDCPSACVAECLGRGPSDMFMMN